MNPPVKFLPGMVIAWKEGSLECTGVVKEVLASGDAVITRTGAVIAEIFPVNRDVKIANPKTFRLANGHTILHHDAEKHLVIADLGDRYERFVVWRAEPSLHDPQELMTHAGHYCKTILDAVEDFYTR